jgi:hypothetical protein
MGMSVNMNTPEIAKATKLTMTARVSLDMKDVGVTGSANEKSKLVPTIAV